MYNIILEYILNSKFPNANGVARDRKIMGGGREEGEWWCVSVKGENTTQEIDKQHREGGQKITPRVII